MSKEVTVARLPECDLCNYGKANGVQDVVRTATVDGRMRTGSWANMCDPHWRDYGVGRLGTGYGQRLRLSTERLTHTVREANHHSIQHGPA